MSRVIGLYPGTFDPVTNGHVDIISRAAGLVDELVIAVAISTGKDPLFTLEERTEMLEQEIAELSNGNDFSISVVPFDNLLVNVAEEVGASVIVKGLRNMTDFEYEYQMIGMNARLNPDIDTMFLIARAEHQSIASRLVKEIASMGGDVSHFVPGRVRDRLLAKIAGD